MGSPQQLETQSIAEQLIFLEEKEGQDKEDRI